MTNGLIILFACIGVLIVVGLFQLAEMWIDGESGARWMNGGKQ